jgi:hypothetical protein
MDNFKLGPFDSKRANNKFSEAYSINYRMQKKYPLKKSYLRAQRN